MPYEIDESIPDKPSLRNVQTPSYGIPKDMQYKVLIIEFFRKFAFIFNIYI